MSTIAGYLVGALLFGVLTTVAGMIVGWSAGMLMRPSPWLASTLPQACSSDDSTWDKHVLGWWFDDPDPDPEPEPWWDDPRGLVRRKGPQDQPQALLTIEQIDAEWPKVWQYMHGAQL